MQQRPLTMTKSSRRTFLKTAVAASGAATLMKGLPGGWAGGVYADDAPETPNMRFGLTLIADGGSWVRQKPCSCPRSGKP